ncbi:cytokine receptor family member b2 [Pseudorasbora parva]|uniref:cytokine receptor family member b2 n=1 Tax=Pseudorasbora parva TaxID=51549 RepID=UPI00351DBCB1
MCAITRALTAAVLLQLALSMDVPAPAHLALSSQFFIHTLSWEKGPGSPDGVRYTVTVRSYSHRRLQVVKGCENVTSPLRCDLTEALSNEEEIYYVSVFAALGSHRSVPSHCRPFKPILNTTFELPLLSVAACGPSLCVYLSAPAEKLHSVYNSHRFRHRLTVSSEDRPPFDVETEGLSNVTLKDLSPGQRYCVNVSIIGHSAPHRPPVCADVPKAANGSDAVISAVLFLLILLILMGISGLASQRFFLQQPLPAVLSSIKSGHKVLLYSPADLIHTLFEDRDPVEKMRRNSEETVVEGETEDGVKYERIVAHYRDVQGSSLLIFPVLSGSELSLSSSTDAQSRSLIVFEDGHVQTTKPTRSGVDLFPEESLNFVLPTHEDDGESDTDVNLFSVTLGGALGERPKAEPDETGSVKDELGCDPQSPLLTESQSQNYTLKHTLEEEEDDDDDECSGYLSRN